MHRFARVSCLVAAVGLWTIPAQAQTPDTGLIAIGADVGVHFPDEEFENAATVDGYGEWYITPRIGVRGMFAWTKPGYRGRTENSFRQYKMLFNGIYNWDGGRWHPFVTAGAGVFWVRTLRAFVEDPDGETRGGVNFGGGVEFFTHDRAAIKVEFRWDVVSHPPGLPNATGPSATFGYKYYF